MKIFDIATLVVSVPAYLCEAQFLRDDFKAVLK